MFLNGPLEFRVLEVVKEDPIDFLPGFWQRFVKSKIMIAEEEERSNVAWIVIAAAVVIGGAYVMKKYYK